jgi:hypothetical protein
MRPRRMPLPASLAALLSAAARPRALAPLLRHLPLRVGAHDLGHELDDDAR